MSDFMEIIHIQLKNKAKNLLNSYLSDKGSKVVMLKILWKNLISESADIFYYKGISLFIPRNQVIILRNLKQVRNKIVGSKVHQGTQKSFEEMLEHFRVILKDGRLFFWYHSFSLLSKLKL